MQRWLWVVGIIAILVGLGFVFPQVAQLKMHGSLDGLGAGLLVMGSLLTFCGLGSLAYSLWSWQTSRAA